MIACQRLGHAFVLYDSEVNDHAARPMLSNNFVVQYNTDLTTTNWITLQAFSNLLVSPYLFLDPAGSGQPARFYRVWMQ